MHCEGDGSSYPTLFVASTEQIKQQGLPFVLIANTLDITQDYASPTTGKLKILLIIRDINGYDQESIRLGSNLIDAVNKLRTRRRHFNSARHRKTQRPQSRKIASDTLEKRPTWSNSQIDELLPLASDAIEALLKEYG